MAVRTRRSTRRSTNRALAALAATVVLSLTGASVSAAAPRSAAPAVERLTGTLPDGATWIADVPENWNGTLIVFSHGFGVTVPQNAPREAVRLRLLEEGYALTGSSYDVSETLWALESAERDQVATVAAVTERIGEPTRTLSIGQSMGGLVNARLARSGAGGIDGALGLCGLVAGANDLHTYQLDAEYTIARLLLPDAPVKLVDFASEAEGATTGRQLTDAVVAAQKTPRAAPGSPSPPPTSTCPPGRPARTAPPPATGTNSRPSSTRGWPRASSTASSPPASTSRRPSAATTPGTRASTTRACSRAPSTHPSSRPSTRRPAWTCARICAT